MSAWPEIEHLRDVMVNVLNRAQLPYAHDRPRDVLAYFVAMRAAVAAIEPAYEVCLVQLEERARD